MTRSFLIAGAMVFALMSPAHAADYAPLDCSKAASPTEKTICSDYGLGQLEARTATLFAITTSLVAMGQRGDIQDGQLAFIKERESCGANVACIRNSYRSRIKLLESVMDSVRSHGPF